MRILKKCAVRKEAPLTVSVVNGGIKMEQIVHLEKNIENQVITFAHILRSAGITLGISEIMEALEVLSVIDVTDREQVYRGLSAVMAKSRRDEKAFKEAFDAFFVPPHIRDAQMAQYFMKHRQIQQLREDFVFKEKPMDIDDEDIETYAAMSEEDRQKVRDFIHKADTGVNVTESLKPVIEQQVQSILRRQRDQISAPPPMPNEVTGVEEWDSILYQMAQQRLEQDLLLKDIADITDDEMKEAIVLIRQLARILANRIGRRYKNSSGHKIVDMRRSIRNGLRYGGVLMELKYKKYRIQKPTVVVITDISGSMLKYSTFLLELMFGLSAVLPKIRSYVFAEHLKRVDMSRFDPDTFIRDSNLGNTTDFYASLLEFLAEYEKMLNKNTVIIILSDTKTIKYKEAAERIGEIRRRVKDIMWLNPMKTYDWIRYSQTKAFLPHVSMVEASTIDTLMKALKDL